VVKQSGDIETKAAEVFEQSAELADEGTFIGRSGALLLILDLLMQDHPDDFGDAMSHGQAAPLPSRGVSGGRTDWRRMYFWCESRPRQSGITGV